MALGKYSRVDGRKSSSGYCWTVSIVVFVALCLVGVWMMTSSSFVPGRSSDVLKEDKSEVTRNVAESNDLNADDKSGGNTVAHEGNTKQFEDNQGDLPEDATKGDTNVDSNQEEKNKSEDMDKPEGDTNADSNQEENKSEDTDKPEGDTNVDSKQEEKNKSEDTDKLEDESGKNSEDENKDDNDRSVGEGKNDAEPGETKENKSDGSDEKSNETSGEEQNEENKEQTNKDGESNERSSEKKDTSSEVFPSGAQSELLKESTTQNGAFSTQAKESDDENKAQKTSEIEKQKAITWKRCNTSAGPDYIPCLDNLAVIRKLPSTKHYEHRERHCPADPPTCVVPLPDGYKQPKQWPTSREKIWYHNVPHTKLAQLKGHQNWVKVDGEYLIFPGGGTQFKNGALHYIDVIQQSVPDIAWGSRSRVVLDVGCGVASFGGFLFERDVLTMSLAPKDEHEAQVQFALERGIPAISAVMGTKRLSYPGNVFDIVHCARCRVPWHIEGGKLLLELNRLLRPGGYFVWSATPIYRRGPEDVGIWKAMKKLTKAMCWEVISITNDSVNGVGIAVYKKPTSNDCYEQRSKNDPPLCQNTDDPNAAWNVPLQACMHKVPVSSSERGSQWPEKWPARAEKTPYWLSSSQVGVYGKPAPEDFDVDAQHWKRVVSKSYLEEVGMDWSTVRNVMDMRAIYGGFAAALREKNLWVMNVVSIDDPDTLPLIYERGLFGIYHNWCESFSTYPRTYDLLHADHLFSMVKKKCNFLALVAEADRILRPGGKIIVRDTAETITELEKLFKSLHWDVVMTYSKDKEGLLCAQKSMWRPDEEETVTYAIA